MSEWAKTKRMERLLSVCLFDMCDKFPAAERNSRQYLFIFSPCHFRTGVFTRSLTGKCKVRAVFHFEGLRTRWNVLILPVLQVLVHLTEPPHPWPHPPTPTPKNSDSRKCCWGFQRAEMWKLTWGRRQRRALNTTQTQNTSCKFNSDKVMWKRACKQPSIVQSSVGCGRESCCISCLWSPNFKISDQNRTPSSNRCYNQFFSFVPKPNHSGVVITLQRQQVTRNIIFLKFKTLFCAPNRQSSIVPTKSETRFPSFPFQPYSLFTASRWFTDLKWALDNYVKPQKVSYAHAIYLQTED